MRLLAILLSKKMQRELEVLRASKRPEYRLIKEKAKVIWEKAAVEGFEECEQVH
jgi:hypothetical protein